MQQYFAIDVAINRFKHETICSYFSWSSVKFPQTKHNKLHRDYIPMSLAQISIFHPILPENNRQFHILFPRPIACVNGFILLETRCNGMYYSDSMCGGQRVEAEEWRPASRRGRQHRRRVQWARNRQTNTITPPSIPAYSA